MTEENCATSDGSRRPVSKKGNPLTKFKALGRPIAYYANLAHFFDDINSTLFICQLAYWSNKGKRKDGWIYKTDKEMGIETGLTPVMLKRVRKRLITAGYIEAKRKGIPAKNHYRLNLKRMLDEFNKWKVTFRKNQLDSEVSQPSEDTTDSDYWNTESGENDETCESEMEGLIQETTPRDNSKNTHNECPPSGAFKRVVKCYQECYEFELGIKPAPFNSKEKKLVNNLVRNLDEDLLVKAIQYGFNSNDSFIRDARTTPSRFFSKAVMDQAISIARRNDTWHVGRIV